MWPHIRGTTNGLNALTFAIVTMVPSLAWRVFHGRSIPADDFRCL
jgi:hypothetical protein